ncbi:MAG: hypothetical protein U9Q33_06500 [Campylobacterota bacterium]|nr:hypothetical protein [Campylobacterota bacterium]
MNNTDEVQQEIQGLISEYATIRKRFEEVKQKHPEYLEGNDNYIGIIGEYWATLFLREKYGKKLDKFIEGKVQQAKSKQDNQKSKAFEVGGVSYSNSTEWLDFVVEHDEAKKDYEFISVKAISSERKDKKSGPIKYPINSSTKISSNRFNPKLEDNLSAIIIMLDENLLPKELLYIEDLNQIFNKKTIGENANYCYSDHWTKDKSIVFKYYKNGFDDIFKNSIYLYENNKFVPKIKS